jgi:hypothetical protein
MNIGDRVKIVESAYVAEALQPGKTGRIVGLDFGLVNVVMDTKHPDTSGDLDWPFDPFELEVIE